MALDWKSNLFQSEQTRGLSGDSANCVALDDTNPYFNYRLRRHKAEGDLIAQPSLLWFTSTAIKRRGGLGVHITSEKSDGTALFTDVLIILSHADYSRAVNLTAEPWFGRAMRTVLQEFEEFCKNEGFRLRYPHRQLGLRILCDGSADMAGQALGLEAGEFVTGLLQNLYTGPVRGSYPVISVHLNLPGVWNGYREVGRLYNDQVLFTLGNHWLDNYGHPALKEGALYRLQQGQDRGFVHMVNPDLADRYQVTSTDQNGANVLTLATREGEPLAYMVLAVNDSQPEERSISTPAHTGRMASIPPPMLMEDTVSVSALRQSKTIIPDAPSERIFALQERGALLQKVHFEKFMEGYDVYLGLRGELGTFIEDKAASFRVRPKQVSLVAHVDGVMVGDRIVPRGKELPLEGNQIIQFAGQKLEYRDLRLVTVDGWPYLAELRRPASSNYMLWGGEYRLGRSRDCRVVLPDEARNDNIHWRPEVGDGATIRARRGEIPKSQFYTDSIMVGSEHASIDLRGPEPKIYCTSRNCYVYIRRGIDTLALYPTENSSGPSECEVLPGDEILIGNCLFQVGYTPNDEAILPAPAPKVELSADVLAKMVKTPEYYRLDAPSNPEMPGSLSGIDAPAPRGLGSVGAAPTPIALAATGPDSIIGDFEESAKASEVIVEFDDDDTWVGSAPDGLSEILSTETMERPKFVNLPSLQESSCDIPSDVIASAQLASSPTISAKPPAPPALTKTEGVGSFGQVVVVEDHEAKFELGRRLHVVQVGWAINGSFICGNHTAADLIIPENRIVREQSFKACNYFELRIRGRRAAMTLLEPKELLINGDDPSSEQYEDVAGLILDVIRRDDCGEEDFAVRLELTEDRALPDPRARLLSIDASDPLAAALFTRGLPTRNPRELMLGPIRAQWTFDGEQVEITDYLESYKTVDGFHPFFVQKGEDRFQTAPEDGVAIRLSHGDRLIIGAAVYLIRKG